MPADRRVRFAALLEAVEAAAPTAAVEVFAQELAQRVGAQQVSFLIADFAGRTLVRITQFSARDSRDESPDEVSLDDDTVPYGRVVLEQQVQVLPQGDAFRVLAPVTARGDVMGVLELLLPVRPDYDVGVLGAAAAHELAYVVTAERRHTDLYEWGQRSRPVSLAAEIQRRLLPDTFTCEAGPFTLAGWLEPAGAVGGDTFDYALDAERLYLSMTDAMGHDVDAALLATLAVGSLRNSRRASHDLAQMARAASDALGEHHGGVGFATGLLLSVNLSDGGVQVVNAGHPLPLLVRGGEVRQVHLEADFPLGVLPESGYRIQGFGLEPGDRLVLLTDGMLDRNADDVDLAGLLLRHGGTHPREVMQILTAAVQEASGKLIDDATALCLDWRGPGGRLTPRAASQREPSRTT